MLAPAFGDYLALPWDKNILEWYKKAPYLNYEGLLIHIPYKYHALILFSFLIL